MSEKSGKKNTRKAIASFVSITLAVLLLVSMLAAYATPLEKEEAIDKGLAWLADQQDTATGAWSLDYYPVTLTAFAVTKFAHHKHATGDATYDGNVTAGLEYLLSEPNAFAINITADLIINPGHWNGPGTPDTNGNDLGIYFQDTGTYGSRPIYHTGIVMMALEAASQCEFIDPDDTIPIGSDPDIAGKAYREIMEDMVDYYAWAQNEVGNARGGWQYTPNAGSSDNHVSQFAVMGLIAAEAWEIYVPDWVKTELEDHWLTYSQYFGAGDYDGAFGYNSPTFRREIAVTAGGIMQLYYCGVPLADSRVQKAFGFVARDWTGGVTGGAGLHKNIGNYYAMYPVMRACVLYGIVAPDGKIDDIDWQADYDSWLLENQDLTVGPNYGSWLWPSDVPYVPTGHRVLSTEWALLILQKIIPPPIEIPVYVDIKPGSWPNPINKGSRGVFAVAICGTEDFDVTTIDPATIEITMEGLEVGVSPLCWSYEDVATPYTGELGGGHALGGDGYLDLVLHFDTQEVVNTLELCEFERGETITLIIKGNLYEEHGGTPIQGQDYVLILAPRWRSLGMQRFETYMQRFWR